MNRIDAFNSQTVRDMRVLSKTINIRRRTLDSKRVAIVSNFCVVLEAFQLSLNGSFKSLCSSRVSRFWVRKTSAIRRSKASLYGRIWVKGANVKLGRSGFESLRW
jgi:hypothetical protein